MHQGVAQRRTGSYGGKGCTRAARAMVEGREARCAATIHRRSGEHPKAGGAYGAALCHGHPACIQARIIAAA